MPINVLQLDETLVSIVAHVYATAGGTYRSLKERAERARSCDRHSKESVQNSTRTRALQGFFTDCKVIPRSIAARQDGALDYLITSVQRWCAMVEINSGSILSLSLGCSRVSRCDSNTGRDNGDIDQLESDRFSSNTNRRDFALRCFSDFQRGHDATSPRGTESSRCRDETNTDN